MKLLLSLSAVILILTGCGSGSDTNSNVSTSYVATISADSSETLVQLFRFQSIDGQSTKVDLLQSSKLGYGVSMFILNQGSVPITQRGLPSGCYNTSSLSVEQSLDCWGKPVLGIIKQMGNVYNLPNEEIVVTAEITLPENSAEQSSSDGDAEVFIKLQDEAIAEKFDALIQN